MIKLDDDTWVDPMEVEMAQISKVTYNTGITMYTLTVANHSGNSCNCSSTEKDKLVKIAEQIEQARRN